MEKETGKKRETVKKIFTSLAPTGSAKKKMKKALEVSERKYQAAFEYTGTGMMVVEEDMTMSLINQKMCDMTGYSLEEISQKNKKWTEVVTPEFLEKMKYYHQQRRIDSDSVPAEYEFRFYTKNSVVVDSLATISMIPGTTQSLISVTDITELKAAEKQLRESQKRFKETVELLPSIFCELDMQLKIVYVNKLGLDAFGYTKKEFEAGIALNNFIYDEDKPRAGEMVTGILSGESTIPKEYRLVHHDGKVKSYFVTSSAIKKDDTIIGLRTCLVDISGRKKMEQKLRESEERFRSIYAVSPIGIAVFNSQGKVFDVNESFKEMFGLPELIDCDTLQFSLFEHVDEVKKEKNRLVKNGNLNFESENDFKFAKNKNEYEYIPTRNRFLDWHFTLLGDENDSRSIYLGQVQDITERKHEEASKLKNAEKKVKEVNRVVEGLRKEINQKAQFHDMVSRSPAMQEIFNILPEIAQPSTTVLVTGETGTGKELITKCIHELSPRKSMPFVSINCGALPDNLLESELFGYVAGAFTDAKKDKPGKFALANGGTIFLDEIGDITPAMQVKLLRVLQEKTFEPLGATKTVKVDVRVIVATNKDLQEMVKNGEFREDLYYRIKVLCVTLPALRERKCDIPLLCDHFITLFNARFKKEIKGISNKALELILAHDFPGNIRELENVMEHAFIFCKSDTIESEHFPPEIIQAGDQSSKSDDIISNINSFDELERVFIKDVLRRTQGSRIKAAKLLGIHKATLFRKMKNLGVSD